LRKGKIIVLEGIDKAGKTTQSRLLENTFKSKGRVCATIDFPDYSTPIGTEIRAFLEGDREYPDEAKLMLLSANRWERKKDIERMLEKGTIVILNRYYHSNLVYGVSKELDLNWLQNLDKGLPCEDLCIVLDVDHIISKSRSKSSRDAFESDDLLLEKVHKNYKKLARQFNWKLINAEGTEMDVNKKIVDLVQSVIKI
jgi:dTMP kinase